MRPILDKCLALALLGQRRFGETLEAIDEVLASGDPVGYAFLASAYGHLNQLDKARNALAEYQRVETRPIEQVVAERWLPRDFREMFLAGIALAEGHAHPDAASPAE